MRRPASALPLRGALAALALLTATAALAAPTSPPPGKRAFEIADYYRAAVVGAPAVSHDGEHVAFSVKRYDLPAGESWSEIWMMAPDGSGLRQMTFSRKGDRHADTDPRFSPDAKTLLFVSDRSGDSQLWVMGVDGGEPRQLTDFPPGVEAPLYRPDGRYLAVQADVYPECGADADCNKKIADDTANGKLSVHLADALLYRHWTSWRDGRYPHVLLVDADSGKVVKDLTPGKWDSPTFSLGGSRGFDFSPDGKELVYVSNHDPDPASSTNSDLWEVPADPAATIDEKTAVNLTAANHGWDGAPLFSPDGHYLAYLSQATPGYESDLFRLALYDVGSKTVRYVTDKSNFDNWIDDFRWLPGPQALLFQGEVEGRTPLFRFVLNGSILTKEVTHSALDGWEPTPDGDSVIFTSRSIGAPTEVYSAALGAQGGAPRQLTSFNADLEKEVDIRPAEEMWVQGDGDYKVQVFLVKPHDFDPSKKYPLILNVHGGPQQQWLDSFRGDWQVYPGKGYVLAFPNPTGSNGFGQDFVDAIGCDWGGRVYRDVMKVADALEQLPYVDKDRMGAMGWSYGGYMMMWLEGHTDRFKAIASMMGVYDPPSMYGGTEELWFPEKDLCGTPWTSEAYRKWAPSASVPNFKTPTLVITGERDYRVPYTQSLQFFTALQKQGVPSRLVVYPKSGHWPSWYEMAFYYDAHLDWFHRWLGGGAAPWDVEKFARNEVFGQDEGGAKGSEKK
jgi:dipeptidyl aminopeptidase/acylaminoacyl peptidase